MDHRRQRRGGGILAQPCAFQRPALCRPAALLGLGRLRHLIDALPADGYWLNLAKVALGDDLAGLHRHEAAVLRRTGAECELFELHGAIDQHAHIGLGVAAQAKGAVDVYRVGGLQRHTEQFDDPGAHHRHVRRNLLPLVADGAARYTSELRSVRLSVESVQVDLQ